MTTQAKHDPFGLADRMVEDILAASGNELAVEIAEDHGDARTLSIEFDRIVKPIVEGRFATYGAATTAEGEPLGNADAVAVHAPWRLIGRTWRGLSDALEMLHARAHGALAGIFPSPLRLAAVALLAIIAVASMGLLIVRQFSGNNVAEQTASAPLPRTAAPPSGNSQQPQEAANAQPRFIEVAIGASEAEAQANYRALQTRLRSPLTARDPTIRLAEREDRLLLRGRRPGSASFYVTSIGPFPTVEAARAFCDGLKGSASRCTESEYSR